MKINKLTASALLLASATYLSACVPAVIGGAAAGTYVATDERPVKTIAKDATITTEIKAKFLDPNEDLIKGLDIHVDTDNSIVTLAGNVKSHEAARRALSIAKNTPHVKHVINKLTIVQ